MSSLFRRLQASRRPCTHLMQTYLPYHLLGTVYQRWNHYVYSMRWRTYTDQAMDICTDSTTTTRVNNGPATRSLNPRDSEDRVSTASRTTSIFNCIYRSSLPARVRRQLTTQDTAITKIHRSSFKPRRANAKVTLLLRT